jgi:hypothetical protein
MKQFARNTIIRTLASACFLGSSCCCTLLFGQQLTPLQGTGGESVSPIVANSANSANSESDLPPIIRVANSSLPSAATQPAPVQSTTRVQSTPAAGGDLPPVVSVEQLMAQEGVPAATLPADAATVDQPTAIRRGGNFPADGDRRIADFIRANSNNYTEVASLPQDIPAVQPPAPPVPVPDITTSSVSVTPPRYEPVGSNASAPSIGGQATVNSPVDQYEAGAPVFPAATGDASYFESAASYSNAPAYGDAYQADVQIDYGPRSSTFDCCGFVAPSRYYGVFDALYWERNDGVFRASNITQIGEHDFTVGGRITVGRKRDSMRGFEISYMQFDPWIATTAQTNSAASLIGVVGGASATNLPPDAFTAFRDGTYAEQFHKSSLYSLELNRTWWGSDVAKAFFGFRYIQFEDEFRLSMANAFGEQGYHSLDIKNQMVGFHGGMEVLYDIGYRLSFSYGAKLGLFANVYENVYTHINDGAIRGFNYIDKTEFSWNAEFGMWARYKVTPNIRLRAGYEVFGLFDVYDAESTFSTSVSSQGLRLLNDGNAIFHGPAIGFEIYR